MAEERLIVYRIEVDTSTGLIKIDGLTNGFIKQGAAVDKLQKKIELASKSTKQMGDASGLASAAVVELGRTVGDAGYGITAITNNVQQLGTLFTTLIGRTGETGIKGVQGAFDLMGKSLWGPLGIIVAFQALTAAIEYFTRTTREAKEEFIDLEKQLRDKLGVLDQLGRYAVDDADALSALRKEFKELDEFLSSVPEDQMGYVVIEEAVKRMEKLLKVRNDILVLEKQIKENDESTYAQKQLYVQQQERMRDLLIEEANLRSQLSALKQSEAILEAPESKEVIDPITNNPLSVLEQGAIMANESLRKLGEERFNYFERSDKLRTKSEKIQSDNRIENLKDEAERRADLMEAIGDGVQSLGIIIGRETQIGKAVAAAGALIETYSAITKTLNAFAGKAIPGYAIAQAVATGLFGFAQVRKIYETNVPSRGGGGGAGAGATPSAPAIQQPSFNIVGQTQGNQIRDTIQEALGKPIRAYVTTRDIRSGEELDRNIVRGATVG